MPHSMYSHSRPTDLAAVFLVRRLWGTIPAAARSFSSSRMWWATWGGDIVALLMVPCSKSASRCGWSLTGRSVQLISWTHSPLACLARALRLSRQRFCFSALVSAMAASDYLTVNKHGYVTGSMLGAEKSPGSGRGYGTRHQPKDR